MSAGQKLVELVPIEPPPAEQRVRRNAAFATEGEKKTRYHLPDGLESCSPIGYRTRVPMSREEVEEAVQLLSMERIRKFDYPGPVTEQELFEEVTLGILTARQSTNYRGHQQVTFGPEESAEIAGLLCELDHLETPVLTGATMTHVVLSRPYRTPFTFLLTFIGHLPLVSLMTVPWRAFRKRFHLVDDIPTIGYLQQLHIGILADHMERAAVIASQGRRRAQIIQGPFTGLPQPDEKQWALDALHKVCGLSDSEVRQGWRIALVAQVGTARPDERVIMRPETYRKLGANLVAFRSERIQPGVNQESKAPEAYQHRQDMDVNEELTVMAGRAAYNAFAHWTGCDRERSKDLVMLERVDVLTPNGKTRLRQIRDQLAFVTDKVVANLPWWADWPTGKALSSNAARGKKAFALAGQRIYLVGLSKPEIEADGMDWNLAVRATGALACRGGLVGELFGVMDLPDDCDLLAGVCLMAGPVNQNDIGKQFYGQQDLLADAFPGRDPTSLLVWTLKAKTVADPIGNEEQLMNADRKGALVDLRPGPHDVVKVQRDGKLQPFRWKDGKGSSQRAFGDQGNFVTDASGTEIPGNRGQDWPSELSGEELWEL